MEFAIGLQGQLTAARSAEEVAKTLATQQANLKFQIKKAKQAADGGRGASRSPPISQACRMAVGPESVQGNANWGEGKPRQPAPNCRPTTCRSNACIMRRGFMDLVALVHHVASLPARICSGNIGSRRPNCEKVPPTGESMGSCPFVARQHVHKFSLGAAWYPF